ncbi:MAG: hypothetical protein IT429_14830 [Gemmataceae bacterium]|nr:hypothetical protein [Gemmataceae bacterium]
MRPYRTQRRLATVEARVSDAVCVVLGDVLDRVADGICSAALLLCVVGSVAAGLVREAGIEAWEYAHPADRRALADGVRRGLVLLWLVPGQTAAALVAAWCWCDRQACDQVRRCHDALLADLRRVQQREERHWLEMRQPFRPETCSGRGVGTAERISA